MKFEEWLEKEDIELKPWQMTFAKGALKTMRPHRDTVSGKSFVMRTLSRFVDEHGNDFEL